MLTRSIAPSLQGSFLIIGILLVLLAFPTTSLGQQYRTSSNRIKVKEINSTLGRTRRNAESEAEDQHFRPWPAVKDGERGTVVHVYASLNGGGIEILTYPRISPDRIISLGNRIATELDKPGCTLEIRHDTDYSTLGLDLDYTVTHSGNDHHFDLNVGKLAQTLLNSPELSQPISIWLNGSNVDEGQLTTGIKTIRLNKSSFYTAQQLATGAEWHTTTRITWVTYLFAVLMTSVFVFLLGVFARMPWMAEKGRREFEKKKAEQEALTPEDIQRKYDEKKNASPLKKIRQLIYFLPVVLILGVSLSRREMVKAFEILPIRQVGMFAPLYLFGAIALVTGLAWLVYSVDVRRRATKDPTVLEYAKTKTKTTEPALRTIQWAMAPLISMMATVLLMPFLPAGPVRLAVLFPILIIGLVVMVIGMAVTTKRNRRILGADDPVYLYAQEFAKEANVKLRKVQESELESVNASMHLNGTLTVTKGLTTKMEPDEVRAIIAHEIGHRKARHVQKLFPLSLGVTFGFLIVYEFLIYHYQKQMPAGLSLILRSPVVYIIFLPFLRAFLVGNQQLKYEKEADIFAAKATGDPELVIRALTKVHDLNKQPHRITASDERLTAHPSLENRIAAIREAFPTSEKPKPPIVTNDADV